jgi:PAS domain S-box-containing protein
MHGKTSNSQEETHLTNLFRILVENVPDFSIFLTDTRNRVISWNDGAARMFGYSEKEMLGQDTAILFTPEDRAQDMPLREIKKAERDGRAADERWHLRKDGSRFYVSGTVIPIVENGKLIAFAKLGRDLTDRVEQQESLRRANDAKDEFLAIVSHELRTPLTATLGWAQLARAVPLSSETLGTALEAIERTTRLQAQLVDDLMDGAAIVAGKLRLDMRPVQVSKCVEAAVATVQHLIEERGVDFKAEIQDNIVILGDSNRLQQIIWNMLTNAIKFTPMDGFIKVKHYTDGGDAVISVTDSGDGIAAEFLPFVFDRFRQSEAPNKRSQKGLGLGLAIVKHLTEAHGGTVKASSPGIGHGAQFEIRIPILGSEALQALERTDLSGGHAMEKAAMVPSIEGVRVLLVDDDPETLMMLRRVLEGYGAEVTAVSNAADARAAFDKERPDVLLSDIALPAEDGYGLIASIRDRENDEERTPAIAVTAFTRPDDRIRVLSSGFNLYLSKPVDMAELKAAIVSVTDRA